jgi:K+-transporting ATPase ATPase C chain
MSLRLAVHVRPALVLTVLLTVVIGLLYPAVVTVVAQSLFPAQANGSLIMRDGRPIGSALIGQRFTGARYLHPRPSAAGAGYDATASAGSNKGPTDSTLAAQIALRVDSAVQAGATRGAVPADLVTASASGLDPDLSPASAQLQAARVAQARGVPTAAVEALITAHLTPRQFGVLGEPRVNVLAVNLALDSAFGAGAVHR